MVTYLTSSDLVGLKQEGVREYYSYMLEKDFRVDDSLAGFRVTNGDSNGCVRLTSEDNHRGYVIFPKLPQSRMIAARLLIGEVVYHNARGRNVDQKYDGKLDSPALILWEVSEDKKKPREGPSDDVLSIN